MRPALTLHSGGPQTGAATPGAAELTPPRVCTWLTARERAQVHMIAGPGAALTHCDAFAAVEDNVTRGYADAVLVSAALVRGCDVRPLGRLTRGSAALALAGLVTEAADDAQALAAAHAFGLAGVPAVFDCRRPGGWAGLRAWLAQCEGAGAFHRASVSAVLDAVRGGPGAPSVSPGLARFFALAFAPDACRARDLAADLGLCAQTLNSRFFRAGLPSPKRYITWARLAWAAKLAEAPAVTVADVAHRLGASSTQAFSRALRLHIGLSPREFRRRFTGASLLAHYRATLVTPHRERLLTFDPTGGADVGACDRAASPRTPALAA